MPGTVLDDPLIVFGREVCGDPGAALRREWLVTNGLGGYASSTLAGVNTRRYHGWLVAALEPPVARTVLVGGAVEWAAYDGGRYALSTHEFGDGTIHPDGYRHLQAFWLEGLLPVWTFALADALLERRIWMAHGRNTTYVTYALVRGGRPVDLEITPLVTYRDFHSLTSGRSWRPEVGVASDGMVIRVREGAVPFRILCAGSDFIPFGDWYWNFRHREEAARGFDDRSDLFAPGIFRATLRPGDQCALVCTTEEHGDLTGRAALETERTRQAYLLRRARVERAEPFVQQLTLAADQFVVQRHLAEGGDGDPPEPAARTVIAGYHWFNDWGRDTMIALPGLCLATGRADDAADILRTFARYVADGLLPNNFPDRSGASPGYNTVDAALWFILAIHAYEETTRDSALAAELLPVMRQMADAYQAGARFGIGADPADGLLRAGEPGYALTWMDAIVGNLVVTPRIGKPVEINALWYNALRVLEGLLARSAPEEAKTYGDLAAQVRASFRQRFVRRDSGGLADVVDGPAGDDHSLRPNQIFAVSLPFPLLDGPHAQAVVDAVGRALLTTFGLRSLNPDAVAYHGEYRGGPAQRDAAYHQGPVWPWLMGAFVEAHARVHGDPAIALALLQPFEHHLRDAGLGSISEIFEGDPPHLPRGCIAQAWSVAEILRVWRKFTRRAT